MSPLLIIVIVALVVVFGLGIRYDLKRRHLRDLGDPASYRQTKDDAHGRADRLGPGAGMGGGGDPGGGGF